MCLGTVYSEVKSLYRMVGIDFDDYVLVKPVDVLINGLRFRNLGIVTLIGKGCWGIFGVKSTLQNLRRI